MNVRIVLAMLGLFPCLMGCAHAEKPGSDRELRRAGGIALTYELAKGASNKEGVQAISDSGYRLFGPSLLNPKNGGTSSLGNAPFPRWVDVTWREGTTPGERWTTGKIAGNYRVEVLSRIPEEVFEYVGSGRGAIRLQFRIKDDGVLLAWDVEESVKNPKGSGSLVYSLHGGDFPCETSPYQSSPNCTEGPLEKASWYNPAWIRK